MDLQTRKLYLITYLAQLQDENFFEKIENYILRKAKNENSEFKPFTVDELISRIEKSEDDFKNGRFKTQEEIEKISANWYSMKIIWTDFAIKNLKDIFDYYSIKASKKVAHKIRKQIFESTKQLIKNPESGQIEFNLEKLKQNHRYLINGNYKIIYKVSVDQIIISDIFDARQNPIKMNDESRKNK